MEIVLQGGLYPHTYETACHYADLDFIERVIISTWNEDELQNYVSGYDDRIDIIRSDKPIPNYLMNMNLQIVSSLIGLERTQSKFAIKIRTDQRITHESMYRIKRFTEQFGWKPELNYNDGAGPQGPIYVIGMESKWPYHPQDHIFWGHTSDLIDLFTLPLMDENNGPKTLNFRESLRVPMYLGAHYMARFHPEIYNHIKNFKEYLVDGAPKFNEALKLSSNIQDKIFKVMPKVDMWWEKYGGGYKYDLYCNQGQYYYNREWAEG